MSDRDIARMIHAQAMLQRELGYDVAKMTIEERVEYLRWNAFALEDEIHEAMAETSWKPWATDTFINEHAGFGELRDAWQFLTNMMLAMHPTLQAGELGELLMGSLEDKMRVNLARHREGYSVVGTKCPDCHRSYDDTAVTCTPGAGFAAGRVCRAGNAAKAANG